MNIIELKKYIINNNELENILLDIGCSNIHRYSKEWRFSTPINKKSNSTAIKLNESL